MRHRFWLYVCVLAVLAARSAAQDPQIPADTADVKTTASGLKYCILSPGKGEKHPKEKDAVKVQYSGWLTDGKLFDSSVKRNTPATFGVTQVIKGWTEGLQLMTVGARFKFTIPWNIAYGEQGRPPSIPAKADLIFEVELLDILEGADFIPGNPEKQKTTAEGIKVEILKDGSGTAPTADDGVELKYYIWNTKGEAVQSWLTNGQRPMASLAGRLPIKFLPIVVQKMTPGQVVRCEVPAELAFGNRQIAPNVPANSVTVWQIELTKVNKIPVAFAKSDPEKTKTTASGLKYEVIKDGTGAAPHSNDRVSVHYAGWLESGKLFDSSFARGEATTFPIGQVIKGWTEGLQLMKEGAIYKFTIPGELAYGASGQPQAGIGPNATLIFYVELLKIVK